MSGPRGRYPEPMRARRPIPILIGVVTVIALGFGIRSCATSSSDASPEVQARVACRDGVEQLLKNPSTAKYSDETVTNLGTKVTMTGTVVAENALGGKVTSTFTCDYYDNTAHVRITSR